MVVWSVMVSEFSFLVGELPTAVGWLVLTPSIIANSGWLLAVSLFNYGGALPMVMGGRM